MSSVTQYLKRVLQSHQKGEADSLQDTFLIQCVLYLLQLHYLVEEEDGSFRQDHQSDSTDICGTKEDPSFTRVCFL